MRALETALLSAPPHKTRTSAAASSAPAETTGASGTAYLAAPAPAASASSAPAETASAPSAAHLAAAAPAAAPSAETASAPSAADLAAPAAQTAAQISF